MPRLSIIIPVLDSTVRLETTLVSVLEHRPADCEIIVVLNGDYDDPYKLDGEVQFLHVSESLGLVECLNEGVWASTSPVVHLLSSGIEASEGWIEAALDHFRNPRTAAVAPVVRDVLNTREVLAAGLAYSPLRGRTIESLERSQWTGTDGLADSDSASCAPREILGPLLQAGFFRRSALELVGGLPSALGDYLADADLALTLRYAGYQAVLEPQSVVYATRGDLLFDAPHGLRHGLAAERLYWRTAPIVGWGKALLAHPFAFIRRMAKALPHPRALAELFGSVLGCCQLGSYRDHHQWLLDVQRAATALFRPERPQHLRIDEPHLSGRVPGAAVVHASSALGQAD